jgi:hypothetical protein
LALLLLLIVLSMEVRARSLLLTRKIDVVLAGLKQVRVDATIEEQPERGDRSIPSNPALNSCG